MNLETLEDGSLRCADDPGEPGYNELSRRISVSPQECEILAALAFGRSVVEIGTGLGVSTRAMAATAKVVQTVDIDAWVHQKIWPNLPPHVRCCTSASAVMGGADMVFIDGLHTAEALKADIALAQRVLSYYGLIVFHDIRMPVVKDTAERALGRAIRELAPNLGWVLL